MNSLPAFNPGPPANPSADLPSLFIVYNGTMAGSHGIGGGDQVILKFIRLSGFKPDLIVPESVKEMVRPHGKLFLTRRNPGHGLLAILWAYAVRTFKGVRLARRLERHYDLALAVSAINVDLLPLRHVPARRKGVIIYHVLPERKGVDWKTRFRFWLAERENRRAMKLVAEVCDFIVAGNDHTKRELEALFPGKEVVVLHAGFDADAIDAAGAFPKNPKLALFMGRLTSQKGVFDLLDVMEGIQRREPDFKLVLLGMGPDQGALEREIARRKITNMELKGFVSDTEKYQLLHQAAFFFFPSYEEGWGIALAEALYCGARCICYELPHYHGIFGDFPAYVKLGDKAAFEAKFWEYRHTPVSVEQREYVRRYHDPNVVQQLVKDLRRFAALSDKQN